MSAEDQFGLFEDENDPLDIMFAVSQWRRESVRALLLQGGSAPDVLQGEFVLPWSQGYFEELVKAYADQNNVALDSNEARAIGLWFRDSILFAERVALERIGGQAVRIRKKRSPMRLKHDIGEAVRAGLSIPEIMKKLGVSQATVYRELKKKDGPP